MSFSDYCKLDWPDTERAKEFLQRAAEQVGIVIENVTIEPGGKGMGGKDAQAVFARDGNMIVQTVHGHDAELAYGAGLIAIGEAALRGEKLAGSKLSLTPERSAYTAKMARAQARVERDTAQAARRVRAVERMAQDFPGTRDVMEVSLTKLIESGYSEQMFTEKPSNPDARFDHVLASVAYGESEYDPEGEVLAMMKGCASPHDIMVKVLDICIGLGEVEDRVTHEDEEDSSVEWAKTEEQYAEMIVKQASASSGGTTETWASEKEANQSNQITEDSMASAIFREVMTEDRIERESGHYTGLVSQPTRMFSDYRLMSRRLVQEETPDSLFVLLVDNSGSMGGDRWDIASLIHDGVMKAFHDLNVPAISAAFNQQYGSERVHPVCRNGDIPVQLDRSVRVGGGTGDLGAMHWATTQLNESGKKGRVVLVISDAEGPTDQARMKRAMKILNANVVHVDVTGRGYNCYGVEPISLTKVPDAPFYYDLASRLRRALELEGEVEA